MKQRQYYEIQFICTRKWEVIKKHPIKYSNKISNSFIGINQIKWGNRTTDSDILYVSVSNGSVVMFDYNNFGFLLNNDLVYKGHFSSCLSLTLSYSSKENKNNNDDDGSPLLATGGHDSSVCIYNLLNKNQIASVTSQGILYIYIYIYICICICVCLYVCMFACLFMITFINRLKI